jgi:hypothetical protein
MADGKEKAARQEAKVDEGDEGEQARAGMGDAADLEEVHPAPEEAPLAPQRAEEIG